MKFKYYLRGIGIGIIFASIVFLVAYKEYVPTKMTNEEIINRAKQLGMVEANDPINKLIDKKNEDVTTEESADAEEVTTEELTAEGISNEGTSEDTTESTTAEVTKENTAEAITTEKTTEKVTESTTTESVATEKATTEEKQTDTSNNGEEVEITISRGSSSYPVCQKLFELGLIDDAAKYDDYLIEKGYANRISVGTHKLKKGMDYKTIAELISDPVED